jgi:ectoine hydroxylase-related dioxygenase (phytanoyl-CoA dioxygenase family)
MKSAIREEGFAIIPGVLCAEEARALIPLLPVLQSAAGTRNLLDLPWTRGLASDPRFVALVEDALDGPAIPVRAILFDKSPVANWNLGWHQDKKIAVKRRVEVAGYSAWSEKEGIIHCQAPAELLEACVAVRIHLDDCGAENGPLRVLPGSHRHGILAQIDPGQCAAPVDCLVRAGDVILMKPLVLHASSKASSPDHRRVIHIEYCGAPLPGGLEWAYA